MVGDRDTLEIVIGISGSKKTRGVGGGGVKEAYPKYIAI